MKKALVLFEDEGFVGLLPVVLWRSVFELLAGRKILLDRLAQRLGLPVAGVWTRDWIARVARHRCGAPVNHPLTEGTILVNGRWLLDEPIKFPKAPCVGMIDGQVAYIRCDKNLAGRLGPKDLFSASRRTAAIQDVPRNEATGRLIRYPWDIITELPNLLANDWEPEDAAIDSKLDKRVERVNPKSLHVGERVSVHPTAILDASAGTIYISDDVRIGPYCVLEGPLYIGPGSVVHPYTWLHGGNSIGPVCKVAGELVGCVINGYSNKQHSGFLGHSYVGSWVNLGAGSNNSNLKNTYGKIRAPINGVDVDTGLRFFGAVIGDHAKIGINATIPTGAVIGMAANIATSRPAPKFIPSFGWMTDERLASGDPLRLLDVATAAMARRDVDMTDEEVELFLDLGQRVRTYEARR